MITIIYRLIIVMVIALVGWNLYTEEKITNQMNCAMVLIPLVLRALMIK
jgi:hypothetical protein